MLGQNAHLSEVEKAGLRHDELSREKLLVPVESQKAYVFPHRSFAEFLVACHLA